MAVSSAAKDMSCWLGVDVGGKRKGFDLAVIDDHGLLDLRRRLDRRGIVENVREWRPEVIAIDSPRSCALDGQRTRVGELEVNRLICGIRWTPDAERLYSQNDYYAWVIEGLALYEALAAEDVAVIEVFPTASWTRWFGRRGSQRRSRWTWTGLSALALEGLPTRTNQDQRDAIAAAVTARAYTRALTESFGEIVVPIAQR